MAEHRLLAIVERGNHRTVEVNFVALAVGHLASESEGLASLELRLVVLAQLLSVDALNLDFQWSKSWAHGRVSKEEIAHIVVLVACGSGFSVVVFTPAQNVAQSVRHTLGIASESVFCHTLVQIAILGDIHQTGRANQRNGTALTVEKHLLAARKVQRVESGKFASGCVENRQTLVEKVVAHIGRGKQSFASPAVRTCVAGVVPPHHAFAQRVEHLGACIGIGAARTLAHGVERIDIHFVVNIVVATVHLRNGSGFL